MSSRFMVWLILIVLKLLVFKLYSPVLKYSYAIFIENNLGTGTTFHYKNVFVDLHVQHSESTAILVSHGFTGVHRAVK